ncbi:MAG: hypothetical protein LBT09_10365 [Planctomycetaceae bacterium]|nr:hypothetical protein [Planctomycetaceae bacterium]
MKLCSVCIDKTGCIDCDDFIDYVDFAERFCRLIKVQIKIRLTHVQDRQDRQQITKKSFDYRKINKMILLEIY